MLEVEEDPSSQFVDFTNATALEQFVADVEQTLIAWRLADKGNADGRSRSRALALASASAGGDARGYTLSLLVRPAPAPPRSAASARAAAAPVAEPTKWQLGLEHFTPTMLAIADATRDFRWRSSPDEPPLGSRRAVAERVSTWFGVDAFVLLSRRRRSSPALASAGTGGALDDDSADDSDDDADDADATVVLDADAALDLNEAGALLSALTIALSNCNCTLPAFVPTLAPARGRGAWLGSAVPGATGNVSLAFETDATPEVSSTQSCISGLLDFFRLKLQLPLDVEDKYRGLAAGPTADTPDTVANTADRAAVPVAVPVGMLVSASFGYTWTRAEDPREADPELSAAAALEPSVDSERQRVLRRVFGAGRAAGCVGPAASPLLALDLTATWRHLREGTYVDNVVHSSLDAKQAPEWALRAHFQRLQADNPRRPTLALSKVVANLVQAYANSRELSQDMLVSELAPALAPASSAPSSSSSSATASSSGGGPALLGTASRLPESIPAARAAVVIGNAIGTLTSSLVSAATWKGTDVEEIRRTVAELFDDESEPAEGGSPVAVAARDSLPVSLPTLTVAHSAPVGELVSILACRMGQLHGLSAMALLWVEFVKALRERWYQLRLLPAMSTAVDGGSGQQSPTAQSLDTLFLLDSHSLELPAPDFHQCLLHQKLQLLNCCILRFVFALMAPTGEHCSTGPSTPKPTTAPATLSDVVASSPLTDDRQEGDDAGGDSPGSDDEFFDSVEQQELSHAGSGDHIPLVPEVPPVAAAPVALPAAEGARRAIPGVVSLRTHAAVLEPVTQLAAPVTEDVAKQQQALLARLGGGVESARLRQQLQSAALVSDMQAFKAANPGCCLADFVRWYSPKDWLPLDAGSEASLPLDGEGVWWFRARGMLSERMRAGSSASPTASSPPHLWQQMWASASPVPAARQRRLFDPLHEAEKAFHDLETLSPHELFHQMLAGVAASALFALESALPVPRQALPAFDAAMRSLHARCSRAVALLDDALAESQLAVVAAAPTRPLEARGAAQAQLQVAFEMALDACWTLVAALERVEALAAYARALLAYFPPSLPVATATVAATTTTGDDSAWASDPNVQLVNLLLEQTQARERASGGERPSDDSHYDSNGAAPHVGKRDSLAALLALGGPLRERVTRLVLLNPALAGPAQREYVLRCVSPRPFLRDSALDGGAQDAELEESPLVVSR
ncbi:hypothetical protein PybrP1_004689, partial [[Pythium] brassicae (nom. inval.)]